MTETTPTPDAPGPDIAPDAAGAPAAATTEAPATYRTLVWRQFRKNRRAVAGLWMVGGFFFLAFLAPFLAHRLPLVWTEAGAPAQFPLVREFFAPSDTNEPVLERAFNFLLLLVPLAWLLRRLLPARRLGGDPGGERWVAILLGAGAALAFAAGVAALFCQFTVEDLFWQFVRAAAILLCAGGTGAILVAGAAQGRARRDWLPVLVLAAVLAVPFFTVQSRNDPRDFRRLVREGRGTGVFALVPYGPDEQGFGPKLPPTWYGGEKGADDKAGYHLLGTDAVGRDVLVRIVHGARVSLAVGFLAVSIATLIGLVLGSSAGYFGGWVDMAVSRAIEIMICFPAFFLILTIIAVMDKRSILNIMLVIGFTGWPGVARLIRGEVLKQRSLEYVAAARALGAGATRVIFRHILPNAIAPVLVSVSFGIAGAILTEAGLSFIGFGVAPPTPTWGVLLRKAHQEGALDNWWLVIFPGLLIFLSVTAYNLVGDGLRDALDPKLRG